MRTTRRDALKLLVAVAHVSRLLGAPIQVCGVCEEGGEAFRQALFSLQQAATNRGAFVPLACAA